MSDSSITVGFTWSADVGGKLSPQPPSGPTVDLADAPFRCLQARRSWNNELADAMLALRQQRPGDAMVAEIPLHLGRFPGEWEQVLIESEVCDGVDSRGLQRRGRNHIDTPER